MSMVCLLIVSEADGKPFVALNGRDIPRFGNSEYQLTLASGSCAVVSMTTKVRFFHIVDI